MAQVSFTINAVDRTRAAFASVQQGLRNVVKNVDPAEKKIAGLGLKLIGLGGVFAGVTGEVRHVIDNIEKIPGVSQDTIDSINNLKQSFSETRAMVDRGIASVVSFAGEFAQFAGIMAGAVVYGTDAATDAFWRNKNAAAAARYENERQAEAAKRVADENAAAARIIAGANKLIDDSTKRRQQAFDLLVAAEARRANFGLSDNARIESLRAEAKAQDLLAEAARKAGDQEAVAAAQAKRLNAETDALELSSRMAEQALTDFFGSVEDEARTLDRVDSALTSFFDSVEEQAANLGANTRDGVKAFGDEMNALFNNVSDRAGQAFADMILSGENAFKQLPIMAARAALEIIARMAIINPLMNMLFGGFGGWVPLPTFFMGAGAAIGGTLGAGTVHPVNERGPELLSVGGSDYLMMGSQSGRVTSTENLGGGGNVYNFTYNIASGVSKAELVPVLKMHERSVIAKIADVDRRGLPISAAMAT